MTASGTSTLFPVYAARTAPAGMAFAADGTIWFADPGANKIGKLY
jgi:streptogramin lyase